ncbi:MAG: hypothetical protein M3N93_01250, partial [Acidobacteriota bacterium]|nr:hypothetical protein [Acidobacteriota bacterium]
MYAQTLAWKEDAPAFDLLGRYEARLSKQLLQYQKEFERLQTVRKAEAAAQTNVQTEQSTPLNPDSASFGRPVPARVMSASLLPLFGEPIPPKPPANPHFADAPTHPEAVL